jgi:hypothetical protein
LSWSPVVSLSVGRVARRYLSMAGDEVEQSITAAALPGANWIIQPGKFGSGGGRHNYAAAEVDTNDPLAQGHSSL